MRAADDLAHHPVIVVKLRHPFSSFTPLVIAAYLLAATLSWAAPTEVFHNPVLHGDYPDPSVVRVGNDYYATATSAEWAPHFPILHSRDLVNWEFVGAVFLECPSWAVANFWAPELQQWDGKFYLYYVARQKAGPLSVAVATADKPEGPWTDHGPLVAQEAGSLDAMAVEDEHGARWLVWKEDGNSRGQPTPFWAQRFDQSGLKLTGEKQELLRNDAPWEGGLIEGPYLFRRGDWFYLLYSGNNCCGRGEHYATGVARARSLLGPWEKSPDNPILERNEHFRGPGHGSLVTTPEGRLFFLYHAYASDTFTYTGRELMLDEVTFSASEWPMINAGHGPSDALPMPSPGSRQMDTTHFHDDFRSQELAGGWQWPIHNRPAQHLGPDTTGLSLGPSLATGLQAPGILVRATTSGAYAATTQTQTDLLNENASASLAALSNSQNAVGLTIGHGRATLWRRHDGRREELARTGVLLDGAWKLRMTATAGHLYQFALSQDGNHWMDVGTQIDGDATFSWDRNIQVGLLAEEGEANFSFFDISPP